MGDFVKVKDKAEYDVVTNEDDVRTDIKIGGEDSQIGNKFVPNINMSKWNDECWLNINYLDAVNTEKESFVDGKVEIEIGNNIHRYYIDENGHLEYEIVLKSKPLSNKIELDLAFPDGLYFAYQDTIENEYNKDHWGCKDLAEYQSRITRPENVECSYAVYWKEQDNKYKTGVFCHIYRPKAISDDGKEIWCNQFIENKKWIIEIDQIWLNNTKFPVTIDPDLGYSTKGGSSWQNASSTAAGCHDTSDANGGNTVQIHVWCKNDSGTDDEMKMCVYDDDAGNNRPEDQLLVEVAIPVANGFDGQKDSNYVTAIAANTKYWIVFINETSDRIAEYYNTADANRHCFSNPGGYDLLANWGDIGQNNTTRWSIWVDYSAAGGVAPTGVLRGPLGGPLFGPIM